MSCPTCGAATRPGQRFCMDCGTALTPTASASTAPAVPTMHAHAPDPNSPHVTQVTAASWLASTGSTSTGTDWGAIDIVEQTPSTTYAVLAPNQPEPPSTITWRPAAPDARPTPGAVPWLYEEVPNRIHIAVIGGIAAVLGIIASIVTVGSTTLPGAITTHFQINDLASNSLLTMIGAVAVLGAGAVLGFVGQRLGIGLAGGAASAIVGLVALDAAQVANRMHIAKGAASDTAVVTVTWEVGFFLLIGAGVVALIAFFTSFAAGADDGRRRLDPVICGIGALGPVAVAIGPMIPDHGRAWSDNWSTTSFPTAFVWLRIGALVLVAITGVIGFATRRRWGAGLAVGGLAVVIVQWLGTMRAPVDPARSGVGIFGLSGSDRTPNVLVLIGLIVTVVAAIAAVAVDATGYRRPDPNPR